jgi:hypothetical protein
LEETSFMSKRNFQMRLRCSYEGSENKIATLEVEQRAGGHWQALDLGIGSPGFDIFVYAVLTCQHTYFRVNCAERGLRLESARGSIRVGAGEDWRMDALEVEFSGQLASGSPAQEDIDYIVSRMSQCPASKNLRDIADARSHIDFSGPTG